MVEQTCPHEEQLASFVRCELSEEVAANVLDHLDSCPHCEETVAKLEHTIKSVLPGAAATMIDVPYADESACQRAVQSLVSEFAAPIPDTDPGSEKKNILEPNAAAEFQTLRDFRIIEKVGQGGMGTVYKAVHQRMQRTVALKVLPSAMIGDQGAVARFSREMSVLGQLNHPNIVQAFDAGEHDGQHYLAMEFIEGQDLASVLRKQGRLSVANACLVGSQAASALQYAHEKGFVHRDIKPSNLMLAETMGADGNPHANVKLLDLGLACVFEQRASANVGESGELTSAGQIMGTLDYMAPEQGSDSHRVDIRTDIYSLGATLYKLLTGEAPFAEHAGKAPMQRLMAIATQDARPVMSRCPQVPEKLAKVIHRMLEKDPARRFQTPVEVTKALAEFTAGACLIELLEPPTRPQSESVLTAPEATHPNRNSTGFRRRILKLVGGFTVLALLASILVLTTAQGRIEVTSPDGKLPHDLKIVVLQGGQELQILQADNHWTVRVNKGEYEVELLGGDDRFEIQDSTLTVSRFGKTRVKLIAKQEAVPHTAQSVTLRPSDGVLSNSQVSESARFLLEHGGQLVLQSPGDSTDRFVDSIEALLQDDSQVVGVYFEHALLPDSFWNHVARFTHLRILSLGRLDNQDFDHIAKIRGLRSFAARAVRDDQAAKLADLSSLVSLGLNDCQVSDSISTVLDGMPNLEEISLSRTSVSATILDHLRPGSLNALRVAATGIRGSDLTLLSRFQSVADLTLSGDQLDEAGCKAVAASAIKYLVIEGPTPPDWAHFRLPGSLEQLIIAPQHQFVPDLTFLTSHSEIRGLRLMNCEINTELLTALRGFRQLDWVDFYDSRVSETDLEQLRQALPNCRVMINSK